MLSQFYDGYDKYPCYQMFKGYGFQNSLQSYNPKRKVEMKIKDKSDRMRVEHKIKSDIASGGLLIEDINLVKKAQKNDKNITDPYNITEAQKILENDPVSLNEDIQALGKGLKGNIKGFKKGRGNRKHTSIYDYLL